MQELTSAITAYMSVVPDQDSQNSNMDEGAPEVPSIAEVLLAICGCWGGKVCFSRVCHPRG